MYRSYDPMAVLVADRRAHLEAAAAGYRHQRLFRRLWHRPDRRAVLGPTDGVTAPVVVPQPAATGRTPVPAGCRAA